MIVRSLLQALLLVCGMALATAAPAQTAQENVRGEVLEVNMAAGTITVRTDDGINTYDVDPDTEFTFDVGRGNGLADVERGDRVLLDFEESADGKRRTNRMQRDTTPDIAQPVAQPDSGVQTSNRTSVLPQTATSDYNMIAIGVLLMLFGMTMALTYRRKKAK